MEFCILTSEDTESGIFFDYGTPNRCPQRNAAASFWFWLLLFIGVESFVSLDNNTTNTPEEAMSSFVAKLVNPSFYVTSAKNFVSRAHDYYHPLIRQGSAVPLWHMMTFISVSMYTTSYMARDYPRIQHEHQIQKEALHEYWEKRGGAPDHH
eukprot:scaffold1267_cov171-Amphora_coffeaeformis.AAC.26